MLKALFQYVLFVYGEDLHFIPRTVNNEREISAEANVLRRQATVIALSPASGQSKTLEIIAEPDHIVNLEFAEMTDRVVSVFCPSQDALSCNFCTLATHF